MGSASRAPVVLLIPGGKMAFLFEGLIFLAEDLQRFQRGVWRTKGRGCKWMWKSADIELSKFSGRGKLMVSLWDTAALLLFDDDCWIAVPDRTIFGITYFAQQCKITVLTHSIFYKSSACSVIFFNLTGLAVELMFKPVFYVFLMTLSEDITDEFRHLWILVTVYEIELWILCA